MSLVVRSTCMTPWVRFSLVMYRLFEALNASQSDSPGPSNPVLELIGRKSSPLPVDASTTWMPPPGPPRFASETYIFVKPALNAMLSGELYLVPSARMVLFEKTVTTPVVASSRRMSFPPNSVTYRLPWPSNAEPVGVFKPVINVWTRVPDGVYSLTTPEPSDAIKSPMAIGVKAAWAAWGRPADSAAANRDTATDSTRRGCHLRLISPLPRCTASDVPVTPTGKRNPGGQAMSPEAPTISRSSWKGG